jgi:hypothetical protein
VVSSRGCNDVARSRASAAHCTGRLIHNPPDDHATSALTCNDVTGFRGCE